MTRRERCPACSRMIRVRNDGRFYVHERDTTVAVGDRSIYSSEPCPGSNEAAA